MVLLGLMLLGVALLSSIASVVALLWGRFGGGGTPVTKLGYIATYVAAGSLTLAILMMISAFFGLDYSFKYVADNHSTDVSSLAWLYKLSGLWAGREGSFLLWAWLVSLFSAWIAYRRFNLLDSLSNMGLMINNVVLALFSAGMFSEPNNPFKSTPAEWFDAAGKIIAQAAPGMNPLLQSPAMILHPPTLFIGYAGLTVPFAFAIASLIVNDSSKAWIEIVDRITIFSWLFLGAGIGLGSVWAYTTLGWGGYWGWDPVENASLLPWLTGVALLHSFTIYRRRGAFKRWTVMLAAVTFSLVILGTFITRSGIVESVHGFSPDPVSLWLFGIMIIGSVIAALVGLGLRWETFAGHEEFESLTGKEAAYYFNNVIMLVSGVLVAYMTITSGLDKLGLGWLPLAGRSIPPTTFDAVARPLGVFYVLILAVCPLLSWRSTDAATFWNRVKWPFAGALAIFGLLMVDFSKTFLPIYQRMVVQASPAGAKIAGAGPAWYYHAIAIVGLFTASIVVATTLSLFINGTLKRAEARGENYFVALWNILTKARSQSGGYIAHIGMGIIMIGLVGSSMYVYDNTYVIKDSPGQTITVDQYTLTYQGVDQATLSNGDQVQNAKFDVSTGGRKIGTIEPGQTTFAANQQTRTDAKVLSEPLRDIFVTFQSADASGLSINVKINPLISFAWAGFVILLLGAALAMWPKAGEQPVVVGAGASSVKRPKSAKR